MSLLCKSSSTAPKNNSQAFQDSWIAIAIFIVSVTSLPIEKHLPAWFCCFYWWPILTFLQFTLTDGLPKSQNHFYYHCCVENEVHGTWPVSKTRLFRKPVLDWPTYFSFSLFWKVTQHNKWGFKSHWLWIFFCVRSYLLVTNVTESFTREKYQNATFLQGFESCHFHFAIFESQVQIPMKLPIKV